jgi:uncharacterized protein (TIGR03437 family)
VFRSRIALILILSGYTTLAIAQISTVIDGVTNAASNLGGAIAPGELVIVAGSGLGPAQLVTAVTGSDGLYATQLAGTTVMVNGMPAPLVYTSATQVAAIVPDDVSVGMAQVMVIYQGQASASFSVPVVTSAPGIFTVDSTGRGHAATINQRGSVNAPVEWGDALTVFLTGAGHTTSGVLTYYPYYPDTSGKIDVPLSAGDIQVGPPGVTQIKALIPQGLDCDVPITVQFGNASSQAGVTVAMRICI